MLQNIRDLALIEPFDPSKIGIKLHYPARRTKYTRVIGTTTSQRHRNSLIITVYSTFWAGCPLSVVVSSANVTFASSRALYERVRMEKYYHHNCFCGQTVLLALLCSGFKWLSASVRVQCSATKDTF